MAVDYTMHIMAEDMRKNEITDTAEKTKTKTKKKKARDSGLGSSIPALTLHRTIGLENAWMEIK